VLPKLDAGAICSRMRGLAACWWVVVLLGLLLMTAALAWAFAPIGALYSEALNNPLGDPRVSAQAGPVGGEGKALMSKVFMRLPLALPGVCVWVLGIVLRARYGAAIKRTRGVQR
jgi:hypothetical protein